MSEKIVSLRGTPIPLPGTPNEHVIDVLEKSLALARNGDLKGVVVIRTHYDDCTTADRGGYSNRSTIGLLEQIKSEMVMDHIKADAE